MLLNQYEAEANVPIVYLLMFTGILYFVNKEWSTCCLECSASVVHEKDVWPVGLYNHRYCILNRISAELTTSVTKKAHH